MILSELFKTQSRFHSKITSQQRMDLFVSAFENNYSRILDFLPYAEQHQIKMSKPSTIQPAEGFITSASHATSGSV